MKLDKRRTTSILVESQRQWVVRNHVDRFIPMTHPNYWFCRSFFSEPVWYSPEPDVTYRLKHQTLYPQWYTLRIYEKRDNDALTFPPLRPFPLRCSYVKDANVQALSIIISIYLLGNIRVHELLDDGRGRDRVDLPTLWHSRWVHLYHVKSRPAYTQVTYICMSHSPLFSLLIRILIVLLMTTSTILPTLLWPTRLTRADPITIK